MFKERKRLRYRRKCLKVALIVISILVLICLLYGLKRSRIPQVTLKVGNVSILQDEEIPQIRVKAICEKEKYNKKKLEKNYTIKDLLDDFNAGKGYQIQCEVDVSKEGNYPIKVLLNKKWEKNIKETWKRKIKVQIEDGTLKIENKYGTWDGDKFKKHDGTYVESDFVPSNGKTYYFNESGKKVTGWQEIKGFRYLFNEKGEMAIGWKNIKKKKYYFQEDGKMSVGWTKIGEDTYYFNKKGKMLKGDQKLFQLDCKFDEDGKLVSKESRIDPGKPMLAFTFDDGPGKYTDSLLEKLEEYGARATFFMVGKNAVKYPKTIQRMEELGCEIGNHTTNHKNLVQLDEESIKSEINTTEEAIASAVGHGASLLRPPYGSYNDTVKSLAGMPIMMWSVDTLDWKKKDAEQIREYVLNTVKDGDVVLMHDIHDFSINAVFDLIPELVEKGYQLVTVSELAEARGIKLEKGVRYSQFYKE